MRIFRFSGAAGLVACLSLAGSLSQARAKTDFRSALTLATHNTDTVRTLIHHDKGSLKTSAFTSTFTVVGQEDEIHNREEDTETVDVRIQGAGGRTQTLHYVADVIFVNGKVYYRVDPLSPTWKSLKGTKFTDPYTGGFQRARTKVDLPKKAKVSEVGVSSGLTHVRTSGASKLGTSTVDLWFTSGSKPFVTRESEVTHAKSGNITYTLKYDSRLGPFNGSVVILPPTSTGT